MCVCVGGWVPQAQEPLLTFSPLQAKEAPRKGAVMLVCTRRVRDGSHRGLESPRGECVSFFFPSFLFYLSVLPFFFFLNNSFLFI